MFDIVDNVTISLAKVSSSRSSRSQGGINHTNSNEQWLHIYKEMREAFPRKCGEGAASDRKHYLTLSVSRLRLLDVTIRSRNPLFGRVTNKKMGGLRRAKRIMPNPFCRMVSPHQPTHLRRALQSKSLSPAYLPLSGKVDSYIWLVRVANVNSSHITDQF